MAGNSLDNLAAGGVINFDADAFVKGTTPRFVGSPEESLYLPFDRPLPAFAEGSEIKAGSHLQGHPDKDAFIRKEKEHKPVSWKAILTGVLVGILALFGASKIGKIKPFITGIGTKIRPAFDAVKSKLSSLFNRAGASAGSSAPPPAASAAPAAAPATPTKAWEAVKNFSSKHGKIAAIATAGLLGLYGLYEVFRPRKKYTAQQPNPAQTQGRHENIGNRKK